MTPDATPERGAEGDVSQSAFPERGVSSAPRGGAFLAYHLIGRMAGPILSLVFARRAKRGKEDPSRRSERFGVSALSRPSGPVIWIHAASVGETNAVMPLINRFVSLGVNVVLTSGTVTSAAFAAERLPQGALHQYVPYDMPQAIQKFLRHWRPSLAIIVESEIWPNTIAVLKRGKVPVVLVNGRMSERSLRGWRRWRKIASQLFGAIDLCLARTPQDGENYSVLGAPCVVNVGDMKFDSLVSAPDVESYAKLSQQIGERSCWLAASTHAGEEELIAKAHLAMKKSLPSLLTFLAPRHPARAKEIQALLEGLGLKVGRYSDNEPISEDLDVYLIDTIGEMGLFYQAAPLVVLGGSFAAHGGHNPLEAAQCDCAILSGPDIGNQVEIFDPLLRAGGAQIVEDAQILAEIAAAILLRPEKMAFMAKAAKQVAIEGGGAAERVIEQLQPYLRAMKQADVTVEVNGAEARKK